MLEATPYTFWAMTPGAEALVSGIALATTYMTVVWKSIGLDWLPLIGDGWRRLYYPQPAGFEHAQYPRHGEKEQFWDCYYFVVYGVAGVIGHRAAHKIVKAPLPESKSAVAPDWMITAARKIGLFHAYLGLHHGLWALGTHFAPEAKFGKLLIRKWEIPYPLEQVALLCLWVGFHGVKLMLAKKGKTPAAEIRRRVTLINSSVVFVSAFAFGFLLENIAGFRSRNLEYAMEEFCVAAPLIMFAVDAVKAGAF